MMTMYSTWSVMLTPTNSKKYWGMRFATSGRVACVSVEQVEPFLGVKLSRASSSVHSGESR